MIEKLKKNLAKFRSLSKEEQEFMRSLGKENCEVLYDDGHWGKPGLETSSWYFSRYRIKPDYQPEPKYEDYEILTLPHVIGEPEFLGIWIDEKRPINNIKNIYVKLYKIPAMSNFVNFHFKDEDIFLSIEDISEWNRDRKKIFARFLKQTKE